MDVKEDSAQLKILNSMESVVGTQKNRLDETVLFEHTKHVFTLID